MAVRIQQEPFDAGAELATLVASRTDIGGVVTFTGLVRGDAACLASLPEYALAAAAGARTPHSGQDQTQSKRTSSGSWWIR